MPEMRLGEVRVRTRAELRVFRLGVSGAALQKIRVWYDAGCDVPFTLNGRSLYRLSLKISSIEHML